MSFSGANYDSVLPPPISALQYPDIASTLSGDIGSLGGNLPAAQTGKRQPEVGIPQAEFEARIRQERSDAVSQMEQQVRQDFDQRLSSARSQIATALEKFEAQRADYFARVETEVVQLSLSIAAKILRREAQVDPMLIATLVRMAVEKMREGSSVTARVSLGCGAEWKRYFAAWPNLLHVEVVEDPQVGDQDCILETELGSAHFALDAQLKEIERGFFDLLALRPVKR